MIRKKSREMWSDIRLIAETQEGRQALSTTGAVIAGAYIGHCGPELLSTMHEALSLYAARYPFMDPESMSASLWGGARYFASGMLEVIGDAVDHAGMELSHAVRETTAAARDFVHRGTAQGAAAARSAFSETFSFIEAYASDTVRSVGEAARSGWSMFRENWGAIVGAGAITKQAYEYFEAGDNLYNRFMKRGRKTLEQAGATDPGEVNVSLNAAVAGKDALVTANRELHQSDVAWKMNIRADRVEWISEQIHDGLVNAAKDFPQSTASDDAPDAAPRSFGSGSVVLNDVSTDPGSTPFDTERLFSRREIEAAFDILDHMRLVRSEDANNSMTAWPESRESARIFEQMAKRAPKTQAKTVPLIMDAGSTWMFRSVRGRDQKEKTFGIFDEDTDNHNHRSPRDEGGPMHS